MVKYVLQILLNSLKSKGIEVLIDVLYDALKEYKRSRESGSFDLFNRASEAHKDSFINKPNHQ